MPDTFPPKRSSSETKRVVFLLVGGVVILIAAVVILLAKKSDPPPTTVEPEPEQSKSTDMSAPLVIAQPTRPIWKQDPDAGVSTAVDKKVVGKKKGASSEPGGLIDTKEVNKYINAHFSEVKSCYEHSLKTNSFLEGDLDLNIEIALTGRVAGISTNKDTVRDAQMISCVKGVIRKWQFPKPKGAGVTIAKTFTFKKSAS